jgi:hypothetical protein
MRTVAAATAVSFAERRLHATQRHAVLREYLQFRFRLAPTRDAREIVQTAMQTSLGRSRRCKSWELLERPGDPSRLVLHLQWEGEDEELFRASPECAEFFRVLGTRVRELKESEYRADDTYLLTSLGGAQGMLQFVSDILNEVSADALLRQRFGPAGGERFARLGLWLIEVLGGAKLYSSTKPGQSLRLGPMPDDPLDVEERAQLLELARHALSFAGRRGGHAALSALEANLPLHPALPSPSAGTPALPRVKTGIRLRVGPGIAALPSAAGAAQAQAAPESGTEELVIHEDLLVPPRELLG